ncbi:MAG: RNA ligase family protein, partial [Rhizobiales bacterium]|nr:RNA ligase family protein [Hyphomicrobiales bacterium]
SLKPNEKIVGEYLFAQHSISYNNLPSYFLGFALIFNDEFQSWDDTQRRFLELGISSVPILYRGAFSDQMVNELVGGLNLKSQEGFVVRSAESFKNDDMSTHMAKYVRKNHVQSEQHWMASEIIRNKLMVKDT